MEVFGKVEDRVRKLWKELSDLEMIEDSRALLEEERLELERVRGELEKVTLMEEICWRQKSRVLYIREGDRNTKFFHRIANSHWSLTPLIGLWWMKNCLQIRRL